MNAPLDCTTAIEAAPDAGAATDAAFHVLDRLRAGGVTVWADGDALRYRAPRKALTSELRALVTQHRAAVVTLLQELSTTTDRLPPLLPGDHAGPPPLSYGQRRLWFLEQATPGECTYNLPYALRLRGHLDPDLLERSLALVIDRHEALRTTFPSDRGEPRVRVQPYLLTALEIVDLSAVPDPEVAARARVDAEFARPFDLEHGPLFRSTLLSLTDDDHLLMLTFHHIVFDGWSFGVLFDELACCYAALQNGHEVDLPELAVGYGDFARWQQEWAGGDGLTKQLGYWREQLAGAPALELPTDRPRPPRQTHHGDAVWLELQTRLTAELHRLAEAAGATLFMVLLAAYQVLLARHTQHHDLIVGTPVAGRRDEQTEAMVGFFVNLLPLRGDLSGDPSFAELVRRVRATALAAYEHQDVPFDLLVEQLRPERDLSRSPVFQTLFTLQNQPPPERSLPGVSWTAEHADVGVAKYDLSLVLAEDGSTLTGALEYNTDLFDRGTAERFATRLVTLLEAAAADPGLPVSRLALSDRTEQAELDRWNDTAAALPAPALVPDMFARQVAIRPDAVAVSDSDSDSDETLTYAELDRRANQLARHLHALGVGRESLVGLQVERSALMVVALLGILKSGGAYVPLDPGYPQQRLDYMLADAGASVLVTTSDLTDRTPGFAGRRVLLDEHAAELSRQLETAPDTELHPDQLAYVLYTSGSTGKPKGVEVSHRSVVNAVLSPGQPTLTAADVVLAVVSLCFDGSVTELMRPLSVGARLVVAPRPVVTDGVRLVELVASSGATAMMVPTPFGRILVEAGWPGDGRLKLSLGGEALTPDLAEELLARTGELWNEYGPTETTVLSTSALLEDRHVTIGRPIDNTRIVVLDPNQRPVPVGVPGEICIGGVGLARGYHDRPALTAERFIPDPSARHPGERLYRSGDLGRWRSDGMLEHLGRLDGQVKLRGFRIETGEIEAAIESHPGVRQAAVVLRRDGAGDGRLVAYVVASEDCSTAKYHDRPRGDEHDRPGADEHDRPGADEHGRPDVSELREHLARSLPDYMLPAVYELLPALPTTPVGKVDRVALPAPSAVGQPRTYRAPETATQTRIVEVWGDVLGLPAGSGDDGDAVGIDDDFFALGGESMKAVRAVRRIDPRLPVLELFAHPTPRTLAAHVDAMDSAPSTRPTGLLHRLSKTPYDQADITLVCIPFGGGGAISYRDLAAEVPPGWAVAALEPPAHDFARRDEQLLGWEELAVRTADEIGGHIAGDVVVYGHCVGSALAVAVARRLEESGRSVLGVAVGASFPAARMPGLLGRLSSLWPASRKSARALQDSLLTLGGLSETLPEEEQRVLARNVRHDAHQAEAFYGAVFADPEQHHLAAPLVCVVGGEDRMSDFAEEQVHDWRVLSDSVELEVIEGAEHFFNRNQAPELASVLSGQVGSWQAAQQEPESSATAVEPITTATRPRSSSPARSRSQLRNFAIVVFGQLVSMIGTGITTFALGVWAWQETGRLETFAAVQLFGLLPAIAAGPFAGAVADRFDRRRVMLGCDLVGLATALLVTLLVLVGDLRMWQLYAVVSVAGIAAAFRQPAYLAGATQLVPKRYLGNANGLLQLGTASGIVFAQLLGGALMAVAGLRGAVVIDVATYACALATLWLVRFPDTLFRRRRETFGREIVTGWRYLLARKPLLVLTAFFTGANTCGGVAFVLVSPLALTYMSTASLGTVLAAQGVGMLAGAALMAVWGGTRRRVTGMIGSVGLFAVSALLIGLVPGIVPAAAGMFGIGVCAALISAHWLALVQLKVPSEMQGRLVATCMMLARLATPIGVVLIGPVTTGWLTPLVNRGGPLAGMAAGLAPTTAGRAMALAMLLTGIAALVWTALGLTVRSLRDADLLLPDAVVERPAPVPVPAGVPTPVPVPAEVPTLVPAAVSVPPAGLPKPPESLTVPSLTSRGPS